MIDLVVKALTLLGATFMFIAGLAILRMPDVYMRVSAVAKAVTLGIGFLLVALALHFQEVGVTARAFLVITFFFLTSPISAHLIGRAALLVRTPLWKETTVNDLEGRYDVRKGTLESHARSG
jgi:multicomponent Na+:H+ antiporter subunit G